MKEIAKTELIKILRRLGAVKVRESGDHEVWRVGACQTAIPKHRTIAPGTLRSIREHLAPCLGERWLDV